MNSIRIPRILVLALLLFSNACHTAFHGANVKFAPDIQIQETTFRPLKILMVRRGYLDELRDILVLRGHRVTSAGKLNPFALENHDVVILLNKRVHHTMNESRFEIGLQFLSLFTLTILPGFDYMKGYEHELEILFPRRRQSTKVNYNISRLRIWGLWAPLLGAIRSRDSSPTSASAKTFKKIILLIESQA